VGSRTLAIARSARVAPAAAATIVASTSPIVPPSASARLTSANAVSAAVETAAGSPGSALTC
jgi:hypothetical protein